VDVVVSGRGDSGNFVVVREVGGVFKTFNLLCALKGGEGGGVTAASDGNVFILWTLQRDIREWR
jgi:hypothetical protein